MAFPEGQLGACLVKIADFFTTKDRCVYCFFYRGAITAALAAFTLGSALMPGDSVLPNLSFVVLLVFLFNVWRTNG